MLGRSGLTPPARLFRRSKSALDPAHRFIGFHRIRAVAIETLQRPPSRPAGRQR